MEKVRCITSFLLVLAGVAIVGPASALTLYDGEWSVIILTRSGACDPSYRVGVQIAHGEIDSGGFAAVQGQVTSRGGVKVTVRSGNQWAYGSGLLNKNLAGVFGGAKVIVAPAAARGWLRSTDKRSC